MVLGAGPGGYTAAFRAADLGRRTVLVERYPTLGGVCLNVGCIPSKALLSTAETMAAAAELEKRGVDFGAPTIDAGKLDEWKNGVVKRLTGGLAGLAKRRKVEVVQGTGRFEGPRVIAVEAPPRAAAAGSGSSTRSSRPGRSRCGSPTFPGTTPAFVDSTGALDISDVPRRLLVVGGGIIGLEMASVYDALGSQVTVVELLDELLAGCDRDLVRPLEKRIASRYHAIRLGTRITSVEPQRRGIKVWYGDESRIYDRVLVAVGRAPCEVDAGAAGVAVDERGVHPRRRDPANERAAHLRRRRHHRASAPRPSGNPPGQGRGRGRGRTQGGLRGVRDPVRRLHRSGDRVGRGDGGGSEGRGTSHREGELPVGGERPRAIGTGARRGAHQAHLRRGDAPPRRGGHRRAPHAGELISEAVLAIEMGADPEDIALSIHPHPTLSETLNFAAEMVAGTITDLYLPRRK